jgi:hypothetical protein
MESPPHLDATEIATSVERYVFGGVNPYLRGRAGGETLIVRFSESYMRRLTNRSSTRLIREEILADLERIERIIHEACETKSFDPVVLIPDGRKIGYELTITPPPMD